MIVGTAVRITVETNIQGDAGRITIYNPDETVEVVETAMTDLSSGSLIYEYIYQSEDGDQTGMYIALVEVDNGSYTSKAKIKFTLKEQLGDC